MIIFTNHALKRARERKVSRQQVIATIKEPGSVSTEGGGVKLFRRKFSGRTLEVVSEISKNRIIIITLYWL
jgi:hypothetical protein